MGTADTPTPAARAARLADAALLVVAVTWGGSYLAAQVLTHAMSPQCLLALRFIPSLAVLAAVAARRHSTVTRRVLVVGAVLGLFQAATLLLETTAVTRTSATNAGLLVCLAVLIAPALEGTISRNRLPLGYYATTLLALTGVALLIGLSGFTRPNSGDLMVLAAAGTRACLMVASGHLTRGRAFDALALNTVQTAFNTIAFTLLAGPQIPLAVHQLTPADWLVLAFLAFGCTCAGFLLQLWAIHHTSATRASLVMGTEPLWALAAGIALAGNHLTPTAALGALTIITATVAGQRTETRWRRTMPTTTTL